MYVRHVSLCVVYVFVYECARHFVLCVRALRVRRLCVTVVCLFIVRVCARLVCVCVRRVSVCAPCEFVRVV